MWFLWTLVAFVVLSWIGYIWMKTLITKYEHTVESIVVLVVLFAVSNYFSFRLTYVMLPTLRLGPRLMTTLPLGVLTFVFFSFTAINLWCSFLTRDFDEKIGVLEEEKDRLQRQIDLMRWKYITKGIPLHDYAQDGMHKEERPPGADEIDKFQEIVDNWQRSGGAARVRSIKVSEWKSQAKQLETKHLLAEIDLIAAKLMEKSDDAAKEQSRAKHSVFEIELRKREQPFKARADSYSEPSVKAEAEVNPEVIRRRLQSIHSKIQLVEAQKESFLRDKIKLRWRVHL